MSRTCAVMFAIWADDRVIRYVEQIAERFEELNNMEVLIFKNKALRGKFLSSTEYSKYHVWELVPDDVDRVIYFDHDTLPLRPLPMDECPDVDIAMVPERKEVFDECASGWPIIRRAGVYFNSRFFIAKRTTSHLFERMNLRQTHAVSNKSPWFVDQTFLNVELLAASEEGKLTYSSLPPKWANLVLTDPEPVKDPCMLRFVEGPPHRLRAVGHILRQLKDIERAVEIQRRLKR